jgi:tRNA(adenine34) deaminase
MAEPLSNEGSPIDPGAAQAWAPEPKLPALGDDDGWMRLALEEAKQAAAEGEVPVGALILDAAGQIIGRGRNRREKEHDPTAHAEILAIREAAAALSAWRLIGTTLYVTLEPCPMCAGALVNARVERVVFGCSDPKAGAIATLYPIGVDGRLNHTFKVTSGVLADECAEVLRAFFRARR